MTFEQFRDKLAAECMLAINRDGMRFTGALDPRPPGLCCCPEGVRGTYSWPTAEEAARVWGISKRDAAAFARGFDGNAAPEDDRYFQLGAAYRRKFVEDK